MSSRKSPSVPTSPIAFAPLGGAGATGGATSRPSLRKVGVGVGCTGGAENVRPAKDVQVVGPDLVGFSQHGRPLEDAAELAHVDRSSLIPPTRRTERSWIARSSLACIASGLPNGLIEEPYTVRDRIGRS